MNEVLKRCPFCGSESIHISGTKKRYASCNICGARSKSGDTTKKAIKRWNERWNEMVSCEDERI